MATCNAENAMLNDKLMAILENDSLAELISSMEDENNE